MCYNYYFDYHTIIIRLLHPIFFSRPDDVVEELFLELSDTYPQAYISMICGMCKYNAFQEAHKMYTDALEEQKLTCKLFYNIYWGYKFS